MSDRELLELAAKAAGYSMSPERFVGDYWLKDGLVWNPMRDDGDALRLAVKLGMELFCEGGVFITVGYSTNGVDYGDVAEPIGTDPYAATRRAIVRAAAEIGKEMK